MLICACIRYVYVCVCVSVIAVFALIVFDLAHAIDCSRLSITATSRHLRQAVHKCTSQTIYNELLCQMDVTYICMYVCVNG